MAAVLKDLHGVIANSNAPKRGIYLLYLALPPNRGYIKALIK